MFNPLNLISKFIKSGNQKELDRLKKITQKINSLEEIQKNSKIMNFQIKPKNLKKN